MLLTHDGWRRTALSILPLIAFCSVGTVRGDDWPQWLGAHRDAVWRETGILDKFPAKGPLVRWRAPIAAGYTGPAVADGRVYVMDRVLAEGAKAPANSFARGKIPGSERILCLSEADGKILWKHEYECLYTISYPLGPRTTPLVYDRKVYTLGAEGNLFCLNAESGTVLWSHDLKKEYDTQSPIWGYSAHPLLDGQKLICMVGGKGSTVVAFDKDSGKELWRALDAKTLGYCPPMIYEAAGKRQLIIWHGQSVNGLNPQTGEVYWTVPFESYMAMSISMPRKLGDHLFLTSTFGKSLMLHLGTENPGADVAWRGDPKKNSFDSVFATPFVEDGHVYGTSSDGELVCIKADTGERLWSTLEPNGGKKARSADIFLVKNGDRFFLATEKGDLVIAKLSPKGYQEISRTHLLDPTSAAFGRDVLWSHPAFANHNVYLRNDKEVICVSLAAGQAGAQDKDTPSAPAKTQKPGADMLQVAQMGGELIKALNATPGCLGVDNGQMGSGKFVIFAFFENKKAAEAWYYSPTHQKLMDLIAPGRDKKRLPMKEVPDGVPVMAVASISFGGKPALEKSKIPFSQIAIELYTPLTGGLNIGGSFSPDPFRELRKVPKPSPETLRR